MIHKRNFEGVYFKGTFRNYQQRVLDNSKKYLSDNKINIVAAPGSGKTILGLELIRRLNNPCIILSPTTTIRQQWGNRFEESFVYDKSRINEYVSYDLNEVTLINSITYQALYSAVNKIPTSTDEEVVDYSKIELFQLMRENNIKTICLDEAHHLQNEWQKALEKFIKGLDKDITVISLTATPPYDANKTEWERYISVSGEIDDEIFVPELVKEKTLCPHQDYIIFNFPSESEIFEFKGQYSNSLKAIDEICNLEFIRSLNSQIEYIYKNYNEFIYKFFAEFVALFILLNHSNNSVNKRIFRTLTNSKSIPSLNKKYAERAINFLLKEDLIDDEEKENIRFILKKYSLLERKHAIFDLSERQKRELVSSVGKLSSIAKIVDNEMTNLNDNLRMLILTDYIKKESIGNIGKDVRFDNISLVSIFETIRREKPNAKIGCLSGSLVILSKEVVRELIEVEGIEKKIKYSEINGTNFYNISFKGENREKVDVITKLFQRGSVNILIGTQALLGEGWDSPCINSLILASYVGSFMLSNQMRGRAIRIDKNNGSKVSNIWHLVTVEPPYIFEEDPVRKMMISVFIDKENITSCDFETLKRRFDCFVGPNYDTHEIESGIERITTIKPPFTKKGIDQINSNTFARAKDRDLVREIWKDAVDVPVNINTNMVVEVPKECKVPTFTFFNIMGLIVGSTMISGVISGLNPLIRLIAIPNINPFIIIFAVIIIGLTLFFMEKIVNVVIRNISPKKSIESLGKSILKTMKELEIIGPGAMLTIDSDDLNTYITTTIKNASAYEQNIFNEAMRELLSPIENPRYLIIKKNIFGKYDYSNSYACPSIISKNENGVDCLRKHFKAIGNIDVVYAYYDYGKKLSLKCRRKSYITKNYKQIYKKYKLTKFE